MFGVDEFSVDEFSVDEFLVDEFLVDKCLFDEYSPYLPIRSTNVWVDDYSFDEFTYVSTKSRSSVVLK
jgi:hypothetical protein